MHAVYTARMDGQGRAYVSEAVALGLLVGFIWLFSSIASTSSQPLLRAFFYWAAAGGTTTLLVASSTAVTTPKGAPLRSDTVHVACPAPSPSPSCSHLCARSSLGADRHNVALRRHAGLF